MNDLRRMPEKEFSDHMLNTLQQWLEKGKSKLDPKEFRTLYINKNYSNQDFQGAQKKNSSRQVSISLMSNSSLSFAPPGGGILSGMAKQHSSFIYSGAQQQNQRDDVSSTFTGASNANFLLPSDLCAFEEKDELTLTNDLIGLTFYQVSDQYRRKFLTLHTHFQFEHHPLRKLMEEFRKWLETFIKEKLGKIKQAASLFQKDNTGVFVQQEVEKLLAVVTDYLQAFVGVTVRATVIFYQLDVKSGETTEVCLHNLLTSLTLKNPVYTKVIDLFRIAYRDPIQQLELQIEALQDQRQFLSRMLGISEVQVGRQILERSEMLKRQSLQL